MADKISRSGILSILSLNGAFCLSCSIFCPEGKPKLKPVEEPYVNWKDAPEKFQAHFFNIRHNSDVTSLQERSEVGYEHNMLGVTLQGKILKAMENKQPSVDMELATVLNSYSPTEKNIRILEAIIETIILFGCQTIAIRGNRDDAKYDQKSGINTSNLKAYFQYRVNGGDICLGDHLQNVPRNATYILKTTQNGIISIIRDLIQINIIRDCNTTGGFFSISAEEVRDIGNLEELAVKFRFVDKENQTREEFPVFIVVGDSTAGEIPLKELLSYIFKVGIDPPVKRSQCYNRAGNLSGKIKDVGSRIQW